MKMTRYSVSMLVLGVALVVMLAIGRFVNAQETIDCANCTGCTGWSALETKIKDAGGWLDWGKAKNGIVAVALTPEPEKAPVVVDAFREFDGLRQSKGMKACGMCVDVGKISRARGTVVEVVPLKTGALYLMTSSKGKTVQGLHALYDKGQLEIEKQKTVSDGKAHTCDPGCTHGKKLDENTKID